MDYISKLKKELERAILIGDIEKADEISDKLFKTQGGRDADTVMPHQFIEKIKERIKERSKEKTGGQKTMNVKKIVSIAAAAAVVATIGISTLAVRWNGVKDLVFKNSGIKTAYTEDDFESQEDSENKDVPESTVEGEADFIALQGYPDSNEYKASVEWNLFCSEYDADGSILAKIGNSSNEFIEKYPMYLVYTQEMADKLEEIINKYELKLHESRTFISSGEELIKEAGTGDFIKNNNIVLGGYVYNDSTFHFDGEAVLKDGTQMGYQFGNYVKGTFSDTYLNIGDANSYREWEYTTKSGVKVSLALSENKALVIADLPDSYVTINLLSGTQKGITDKMLEEFADLFDFSKI